MCKVKILVIKNSAVCENTINHLKNELGEEKFNALIELIYIDQENLHYFDEKFGTIRGFPTFIFENDNKLTKLMGGDPNTLENVIELLKQCSG